MFPIKCAILSWFRCLSSLCLLTLNGCGFSPLYAPDHCGHSILAATKIELIEDREGQYLRNALLDLMTPRGAPRAPRYALKIILTEGRTDANVRKDATTRRTQVSYTAAIALTDRTSNTTVYKDTLRSDAAYSVASHSEFATFPATVADGNARDRALDLLAFEIYTALSSYLTVEKGVTCE